MAKKKKTTRVQRGLPKSGGWKERIARDGLSQIVKEIQKISAQTNGVKFEIGREALRSHLFSRGVHYRAHARKIESGEVDIFPKVPRAIRPPRVVGSTVDAEFEETDTAETREFYKKQAAQASRARAEAFDFMGSHLVKCDTFVIDERTAEAYELIPIGGGHGFGFGAGIGA